MDQSVVLIVEDIALLRSFMELTLTKAGYAVRSAATVSQAYALLRDTLFDLILLDLRLEDANGLDLLRTIRRQDADLPVIIISAVNDLSTKVNSFEIGCDDYITKPFKAEEMLSRIRRLLKRTASINQTRWPIEKQFGSGPFVFNLSSMLVTRDGVVLPLRRKLFDLFLTFARHPDTVLSPKALIATAWGVDSYCDNNSLYVHIRNLRTAIEVDPANPRFIRTVRNAGYCYSPY